MARIKLAKHRDVEVKNATALETHYIKEGKTIHTDINDMNPYTNVYNLIELFIMEIT